MKNKRVLILCTGNSARSQMAEGLLRWLSRDELVVFSAGTNPTQVRPEAIQVMRELGVDISNQWSKSIDLYMEHQFDYVITVCDNANESCPILPGAAQRIHWSFADPAKVEGDDQIRLNSFREIRDQIQEQLTMWISSVS